MKKGSSIPNIKGSRTAPKRFPINKPTGKAPIKGKLAKMYHASRGKTSLGLTSPRKGSQY